jgi:hypothetical protein
MERVWNITDGPNPKVKSQTMVVLGRVLKPGRAVQVDAERLKTATKVHAEVALGHLHIGPNPPADYLAMKKPPRAVADARLVGKDGKFQGARVIKPAPGHGVAPKPPEKEEPAPKKLEVKVVDEVPEPVEMVEAELVEASDKPKKRGRGKR